MPSHRSDLSRIALAGVLWGTTGIAVALLRDRTALTPTAIGFYRLAIAGAVLLGLAAVVRRVGPLVRVFRESPGRVVLTGVALGAYQALYFIAVANAGVSVATVVSLGLAPVVTSVWEAARSRTRPTAGTVATIAAALIGLILISTAATEPTQGAPRPLLGLLAAIASGLGYGGSALLSRDLSQRAGAMALTTATSLVGALALLPLTVAGGLAFPVRADTAGLLVYLGVVTTAIAYALFYRGLQTVTGSVAAVVTLLEPLTAALLAVLILGEPLAGASIAGGVLLLGAVAVLYLRPTGGTPVPAVAPARPARPGAPRPGRAR
jgi:DME family drug/metabolite transporter